VTSEQREPAREAKLARRETLVAFFRGPRNYPVQIHVAYAGQVTKKDERGKKRQRRFRLPQSDARKRGVCSGARL
jgi:hypothetical protein